MGQTWLFCEQYKAVIALVAAVDSQASFYPAVTTECITLRSSLSDLRCGSFYVSLSQGDMAGGSSGLLFDIWAEIGLLSLLAEEGRELRAAEVGVFKAGTSSRLLDLFENLRILLVDPYHLHTENHTAEFQQLEGHATLPAAGIFCAAEQRQPALAEVVSTLYGIIDEVYGDSDWTRLRLEGGDVVGISPTSAASGSVYECDVRANFVPVLNILSAFDLNTPTPKQFQDWCSIQGGRLRSLVALVIRLTRRTPVARTEEIQALKNMIMAMPGFKSDIMPPASGDADDSDEADIGEDVAVELEALPAADGPDDAEINQSMPTRDEAAAPPPVDGVHPMDTCEDSQLPSMDEAEGLEASVGGELGSQAPDDSAKPTATIDADGVKDAMPEPTAAAGDEPDGSLDEQEPENPDAAPLLAEEAVQLPQQIRAQLSDFGVDADLQLFFQQRALKAQARQQKAEKTLQSAAKAQARAEAKAAKDQVKQQEGEPGPKALPKRKAKAKSANKRKAEEPAASAGDSEASAAKPKKAKLAGTIESIMPELEPVFKLGLVRPASSQLKQKSYLMAPPETASGGSKIQVNEKKGTNVNWNRHGFVFGFKIAKIIAGWLPEPAELPKSTYDKVNDSPGKWTEAELGELQEFLVSEATKGRAGGVAGVSPTERCCGYQDGRTMPALTNLMLMVLAALTQLMFMMLLVVVKFVGTEVACHPITEMVEKAQARRGRMASASPTPVPKEPSTRQVATPTRSKSRGPQETMPPPAPKMFADNSSEPGGKTCDTPRKQPVRTTSQVSVDTPSKQPVRTVSQTSVHTPSKQPVRTLSQTSVETPSKQPVPTLSQESVETPSKQPGGTLSERSVETVKTPSKQPVQTPCKPKPMPLDTPAKLKPVETPSKMSIVDETPQKHQMHETPQVPMSVGSTMSTPLKSPDYKRLRLGPSEETLPSMPSFEVQTPSSYRHTDTQSTIAEQFGELHLGSRS
ncbi:hypothetical protein AK812_SmicGene11059 [Symbiodinium microadriaticum]|uniref:Uncharacterized protein n=2 Tax=Symbiodinium microadriaticum TaxID=2951 RepID=A0A1Q9EE49_SYMMI|nr:hypothetical protein AK812_SmicGene11059 [Symbiodinium microadriaticum]